MDGEPQGMRTSLYSILCIVIRLGAVMLALGSIERMGYMIGQGGYSSYPAEQQWLAWGFFAFGMLTSFLLWLYPGPFARLASARSAQQVFESPVSAADMQWIALSVLGMYWIMTGILDLSELGYRYVWMSELLGTGEAAMRSLHGQIAYDALEVITGIALTLGARGLAKLLQKMRYAGSSGMAARKASPSEDSD